MADGASEIAPMYSTVNVPVLHRKQKSRKGRSYSRRKQVLQGCKQSRRSGGPGPDRRIDHHSHEGKATGSNVE